MPPVVAKNAEAPRPRRVYRRAAERREEIVAAAREAFVRSTYAGARTRDIAEAAGVNQATLFKLFPTKEALFEEAVMKPLFTAMEDMNARMAVYEQARTPAELAAAAEASTARHLADMRRIFPLLATALFSELEQGKRLFRDYLEPLIRQRGAVLQPLVKDGIDPEFVGLASFGMMFAIAMQQQLGGHEDDLGQLARQFNRFSTEGFARTG